jgi:hypothetical protein
MAIAEIRGIYLEDFYFPMVSHKLSIEVEAAEGAATRFVASGYGPRGFAWEECRNAARALLSEIRYVNPNAAAFIGVRPTFRAKAQIMLILIATTTLVLGPRLVGVDTVDFDKELMTILFATLVVVGVGINHIRDSKLAQKAPIDEILESLS